VRRAHIIEFAAAIATAVLAIFLYGYGVARALKMYQENEAIHFSLTSFLVGFLILVVPGVSVGIASYAHAIKQRSWGYYLLLIVSSVNNFLVVALFVDIVWSYPGWAVLLFVIQFFLVLVAAAAALFSERKPTSAGDGLG
jgi:cytochrome bd-type quinol oxidase subunit 2